MRLLLAILAVLGLLLAPAAAAAATSRCLHEGHGDMALETPSDMTMVMAMDAGGDGAATPMPCCDDDKAPPHDSKSCAQDCALMCAAPVALLEVAGPTAPPSSGHARLSAAPPEAFQGRAPPGLKRPPRPFI